MAEPSIQAYGEDERGAVLDVLTEAYVTNPIHVAVFGGAGPDQARQNRAFFSALLGMLEGTRLVALHDGSVVGYVQWVSYPGCRPSRDAVASVMPRLLAALADGVASRLTTWLRAWRERDPDAAHSHFGPIAVSPSRQGIGIGRLLIQEYCARLDLTAESGYLETDRPENVGFYAKSRFEVTSEMDVLGVRTWFMRREAAGRRLTSR
jgi:GNAT superfamily N-acetyltransferase